MVNIISPREEEVSGDQQLEVGVEAERYFLYWQAELGVEAERYCTAEDLYCIGTVLALYCWGPVPHCIGTVLALYCRYDLYWHWRSKAADSFRLIASDGRVFTGENGVGGVYTLNDLEDWIATKTNMVEIPNLVYVDII